MQNKLFSRIIMAGLAFFGFWVASFFTGVGSTQAMLFSGEELPRAAEVFVCNGKRVKRVKVDCFDEYINGVFNKRSLYFDGRLLKKMEYKELEDRLRAENNLEKTDDIYEIGAVEPYGQTDSDVYEQLMGRFLKMVGDYVRLLEVVFGKNKSAEKLKCEICADEEYRQQFDDIVRVLEDVIQIYQDRRLTKDFAENPENEVSYFVWGKREFYKKLAAVVNNSAILDYAKPGRVEKLDCCLRKIMSLFSKLASLGNSMFGEDSNPLKDLVF